MSAFDLRRLLPRQTLTAWAKVASVLPAEAYLAGGTAVAVHLGHRVSRDLDVFVPHPFDTDQVRRALERQGRLVVTDHSRDTLNGVFDDARIQFLEATSHRQLDTKTVVEGMPVAGLRDLLADKLKAVGDRGELRDYFDLMTIEQHTHHRCEHGLRYYRERYQVGPDHVTLTHISLGLGYFGDVADDPGLPIPRSEVETYWHRRQPEIVGHLQSMSLTHKGSPSLPTGSPPSPSEGVAAPAPSGRCRAMTARGHTCQNRRGSCPHHRP